MTDTCESPYSVKESQFSEKDSYTTKESQFSKLLFCPILFQENSKPILLENKETILL